MINERGEQMVEHHVKYKELHGVDETAWMTSSEHKKLHLRLRKNGKCNVPSDKLQKISAAAHRRTEKYESYYKRKSHEKIGLDEKTKYNCTDCTFISKLRYDGRMLIPKNARDVLSTKPGDFFQITMKPIPEPL